MHLTALQIMALFFLLLSLSAQERERENGGRVEAESIDVPL